jgi:hypothetical protein
MLVSMHFGRELLALLVLDWQLRELITLSTTDG